MTFYHHLLPGESLKNQGVAFSVTTLTTFLLPTACHDMRFSYPSYQPGNRGGVVKW